MKITYKLYSADYQEGIKLAEVHDMSQANVLEGYYRTSYNTDRFKITAKYGRQKEERLTGYWKY